MRQRELDELRAELQRTQQALARAEFECDRLQSSDSFLDNRIDYSRSELDMSRTSSSDADDVVSQTEAGVQALREIAHELIIENDKLIAERSSINRIAENAASQTHDAELE